MLLGFEEYRKQGQALAAALEMPFCEVTVHRFPDGESRVTLPATLPDQVIVCRSLNHPNDKLIELLLTAAAARQLGARRLTLVAPYLCYMRQDIAFQPGEAVSQKIIGKFLAGQFDAVVTVDPHLHRIDSLDQAIPAAASIACSAGPLMGDFLKGLDNPFLLGPDAESRQWVESIAADAGLQYGVGAKIRHGDYEVEVELPEVKCSGRRVVIIDDVISSGETVAMAAGQCLLAGATRVDVLVTHALFAAGAEARMHQSGISKIWSTDSIPHRSNRISLAALLAETLQSRSGMVHSS
jgi:ribose-phosphate pyrophosphokinase